MPAEKGGVPCDRARNRQLDRNVTRAAAARAEGRTVDLEGDDGLPCFCGLSYSELRTGEPAAEWHGGRAVEALALAGFEHHTSLPRDYGAAGLFAEDGTFEVREVDPMVPADVTVRSRAEGRAKVEAYVGNSTAQVRMIPMIHNLIIELDGDRATASSLMMGRVWPSATEIVGEYADSFRFEAGRWWFAARTYTIWRTPAG